MVVSTLSVPYILILFVAVLGAAISMVSKSIKSIRETTRLFATSKSPLISSLSESIHGASTIRAFKKTDEFIEANNRLLDQNMLATIMMSGVNSWFAIRVDIISIFLMLAISTMSVLARDHSDPILLALVLTYGLNIQYSLINGLKWYTLIEQ